MKRRILGLGANDSLVLKLGDGSQRPVVHQSRTERTVHLLLDCSGSMEGARLIQARQGAEDFAARALARSYRVGIITFQSEARVLIAPQVDLAPLAQVLAGAVADGTTDMAGALRLARQDLLPRRGVRAVVLVTDGNPDSREKTLVEARATTAAGIDIITLGTEGADKAFLASIATSSDLSVTVDSAQLQHGIADLARLLPGS